MRGRPPAEFVLILRPLPSAVPAWIRLRRALKCLLRSFGLRAVEVREFPMSTLNSSSTLQQIEAAYADNASYAEDNSVAKARAFVTACRLLVLKYPKSTGTPQSQLQTSIDLVQAEKTAAEKWIEAHDTGGGSTAGGPRVTRVSFENSR